MAGKTLPGPTRLLPAILATMLGCLPCYADSPYQRTGRSPAAAGVYKARIVPHWSDDDTDFWYRNDLPGGAREFVRVNAAKGVREPAFDHARLARSLRDAGVEDALADRLPIERLEFEAAGSALEFRAGESDWRCDLVTYELKKLDDREPSRDGGRTARAAGDAPRASTRTGPETELTFVNRAPGEVELFWLDAEGRRRGYGKLSAGAERAQHTFAGHVWEAVDAEGRTLAVFEADAEPARAEISGEPSRRPSGRRGAGRDSRPRDTSPDGKWTAFLRDYNIYVRSEGDGAEHQLSRDGSPDDAYGMLQWAPDSSTLVAFRTEPGEGKEVYLVESSPSGGGRARLHTRPYALPGDKYASYELNLFMAGDWRQIKPDVERIDFGRPRLRWKEDGRRFTYERVDRGHQRFRVIEIDAHTGESRNAIDETSETFIWTAHGPEVPLTTYLERTDEILYSSERDGWRHLYLVDAGRGGIAPITSGEWVVRGIERIDEENRQVWFRASGRNPGQDPYLVHFCRVNFDGTGLVALTEGDGDHTVQFSPDRRYLIDTYSRADMAPVHELRRASDGTLVCELERADVSELKASGWQPPEVFAAKGRDGRTDIWGVIYRPRDFDPGRKYPVVEQIYAGPQGSFVPKSFSPSDRFSSLTDAGFMVVQIDGMGTANRSKAFHDVCWKNLKDAGLPDRVLWHRAVAAKHPWYDLDRVGIYGVSAGGQNAAAAVLFHSELYKAAVSACGCHDNRMDKVSWNEQWMGYPVGPQYAECSNIDNAHRLGGKLLLIVGEMDTNVPPESTLRLADALIKADKDFDLLVIPGAGHGLGGRYGQRRMQDFFVRHLRPGQANGH